MDRRSGKAYGAETRARLVALYSILAIANAGAWLALIAAAHRYPLLLALGATAYALGLRHAVDPDHIAAIDSTTRKLMHGGQQPVGVGFYFSLGHSTIVFILSALVATFGAAFKGYVPWLTQSGAIVGTSVSGLFLIVLAAANVLVLFDILRNRTNGEHSDFHPGGFLTRILRPALKLVTRSRHMYVVGVLFGLGFDTATEVALLGFSATSGAGGMPMGYILILPLLFVAGMSLVDTTEGVAALAAYGWAYLEPARKLVYNVNITLFSVVISLVIGGIELLALLGAPVTNGVLSFSVLGYGVIGVFAATTALSALFCRTGRRGTQLTDSA